MASDYIVSPITPGPDANGSAIGTALSKRDSRSELPSQLWKRESSIADAFANLTGNGKLEEMLGGRHARDRSSLSLADVGSRRNSQIYDGQMNYMNGLGSVRERVHKDSPVLAELKTNVIIKDEFTLVTDLSYHLTQRFSRADSAVMVKVDHSACLAMGGTFDPCYVLTLTAVPSEMTPSLNKRNALLIQSFLADILSVTSDRGIIKFCPIEEHNFASNGTTMQGQVEKLEKNQAETGPGVRRAYTNENRKSATASTLRSISKLDTDVKTPNGAVRTANGVTSIKEKRRSNSATPPPAGVFELSGTDTERPATSNGSFAAVNGLRMNGVSKEDLNASRQPGERPKTIAGQPERESKADPMPKPHRQSLYQAHSKRTSTIKEESVKGNIPISPRPKSEHRASTASIHKSAIKQLGPIPTTKSSKDTYLDGVSTVTAIKPSEKVDPKIDARAAEKNRQDDHSAAANTAKRRSTVTATPKMPAPPPVPVDKRKGEMKLPKRKSFLSAFRRSTAG